MNFFKTANNNHYLYHVQENKTIFLHPLLHFFSEMEDNGTNLGQWADNLEVPEVTIKNLGVFTLKEIKYYLKKYNLLKEKKYLRSVNNEKLFQRKLNKYDIENLFTSCKNIIFEITEACNMACHYCIGGNLYHLNENNRNLDPGKAKLLLDYLHGYWHRSLSPKRIGIKFFGGEPLLEFETIKEITAYAKTFTDLSEKFYFKITTNGVLLDRYLDFLVTNNFYIAISLDGNRKNNNHRVLQNGKPAFEKVSANIRLIRDHFPSYFEKNVSFQSVLHNLNSITEIEHYFRETYQKQPFMTDLMRIELNENRKNIFKQIYKNIYFNLYYGKDFPLLNKKKLNDLPKIPGSGVITHHVYNWLIKNSNEPGNKQKNRTPTGTCHPFSRGIYLAADGKILPCERVAHKFALGQVNEEVILDFQAIAEKFNRYYENMNQLCLSCSNARFCGKCMFNCKVDEPLPVCDSYCQQEDFLKKLSDNINYIENNPEIYYKHLVELKT